VPERVVASRGVPEVGVEAVVRLAGLAAVVQAVAPQLRDAQHGRDVLRPLVRSDDRGRLTLPDEALQVADRRQRAALLVVDEARPPEGVVEERSEGVGPPVGDRQVVGEGAGLVAERLEVLGDEEGRERTDLGAAELFLERVRLVEACPGTALVRVRHQSADRGVSDAVLRVTPDEPLQLRPSGAVSALDAHRCGAEGRLRGVLSALLREGVEPRERLRVLRAALGRLRGGPFGLLAVPLPHRSRRCAVVALRCLVEPPGALRPGRLCERQLVRGPSLGRAGREKDHGDARDGGAPEAGHDVPWTALTRISAARSAS
jgi:hypothetical protein